MKQKKVVLIKLGSNVLISDNGPNKEVIQNVVSNAVELFEQGFHPIIVTSGAVAAGRDYLKIQKPEDMDETIFKQICSGAGQPDLFGIYRDFFGEHGIQCTQNLYAKQDFESPELRKNIVMVLQSILSLGLVPIINENDVVSDAELRKNSECKDTFSDNDGLATQIALLLYSIGIPVEKVILLSNIDGLCDKHPDEGGRLLPYVSKIDDSVYQMVSDKSSSFGRGGMRSKIEAAERLIAFGIPMHLANGKEKDVVKRVMKGEAVGTLFMAKA